MRRPTEYMRWCRRVYGKTFMVRLPQFPIAVTSEREAIRTIFAARPDEMHAGRFNFILRPLVGNSSVLLLDAAEHMHRRKLLLPSFHGERMRFYGATMADITRRSVASWKTDEPFALHGHTRDITLQIILRTVFGADEGTSVVLRNTLQRMFSNVDSTTAFTAMIYLARHPEQEHKVPWKWLLTQRNVTDALLYQLIAKRREEGAREGRQDVLGMLLQARDEAGEGLTDRDLRDELMTALAAGHETTATALAWAVERLLSVPGTYARLRDEVRGLGPDPEPEQFAALPYLDAVVKEVLRLRPVVPVVGRVLQKPYTLGGFDMPAGTSVVAGIYLAQRDPDNYPDPEAFKPERFLGVQPDPAAWLPFGGGIRRCIGASFALYEMKIVLGTMLGCCDLQLAQPPDARVRRRAVTFVPEGGTRVRARNIAA